MVPIISSLISGLRLCEAVEAHGLRCFQHDCFASPFTDEEADREVEFCLCAHRAGQGAKLEVSAGQRDSVQPPPASPSTRLMVNHRRAKGPCAATVGRVSDGPARVCLMQCACSGSLC